MPIVCVSGGFTILHVGHVRLITEAAQHGDVIVILNSDAWQQRKYGKIISPYEHRAEVLYAIKGVLDVVEADDADGTVCKTLEKLKPDFFANGGDRTPINTPEIETCLDMAITPLFGVGGEKVQSSSDLIKKVSDGCMSASDRQLRMLRSVNG